jgi:hypothetical protein
MYFSQKNYMKPYKYVDIIHNKYLLNRHFNCTTPNMYAYHDHNIHWTWICILKFWLHMQLMGNWSLFMDKYNPRAFTLEDEEDSSCSLVAI